MVRIGKAKCSWFFVFTIGAALMVGYAFSSPKFGRHPHGADLARLEQSPQYGGGEFRNLIATPQFAEGHSFFSVLLGNNASRDGRSAPQCAVPAVKTDLKALPPEEDVVVWLGHSSYFMLLGGKRILVDPVFSDYAAPFSLFNRAFAGTNVYAPEDMPDIDYLLITHDHWDHLDYPTLRALLPRIGEVVCGLGVGSHLRYWGFPATIIHEGDWYDELRLRDGLRVHVLPARHFSGRLLARNKTLWVGFALITPERKIFISGDTGYGPHFAEAGKRWGGFDLALLEDGQYDPRWPYIHMAPEESAQAAADLKAAAVMPGHNGKFAMAGHAWDDPYIRFVRAAGDTAFRVLFPRIGEPVFPGNPSQSFPHWWEKIAE